MVLTKKKSKDKNGHKSDDSDSNNEQQKSPVQDKKTMLDKVLADVFGEEVVDIAMNLTQLKKKEKFTTAGFHKKYSNPKRNNKFKYPANARLVARDERILTVSCKNFSFETEMEFLNELTKKMLLKDYELFHFGCEDPGLLGDPITDIREMKERIKIRRQLQQIQSSPTEGLLGLSHNKKKH
jgi:hypothetical protein